MKFSKSTKQIFKVYLVFKLTVSKSMAIQILSLVYKENLILMDVIN